MPHCTPAGLSHATSLWRRSESDNDGRSVAEEPASVRLLGHPLGNHRRIASLRGAEQIERLAGALPRTLGSNRC